MDAPRDPRAGDRPVTITLRIEAGDPPAGTLRHEEVGFVTHFQGWIGLLAAITRARQEGPTSSTGDGPSGETPPSIGA